MKQGRVLIDYDGLGDCRPIFLKRPGKIEGCKQMILLQTRMKRFSWKVEGTEAGKMEWNCERTGPIARTVAPKQISINSRELQSIKEREQNKI